MALQEHLDGQERQRGDLRDHPAHPPEDRIVRAGTVRLVFIAITLAAFAGAPALAAVPPYDVAKIHPTEAAFVSSIKVYQDALAANPNDADAAYWLGSAYWSASILYRNGAIAYGKDYLDKAIGALERAVSADDR